MKSPLHNMTKNESGLGLVEVLIGASIIVVGILAILVTHSTYVKYALSHDEEVQSTYLLEEGIEAMTLLRDTSWSANIVPISTSATTSLYFNGTAWTMSSTTNEYIDGIFTRNVRVYAVNRDVNGKIADVGTNDPDTRKIVVTLTYPERTGTTTESITKYLVNMYAN